MPPTPNTVCPVCGTEFYLAPSRKARDEIHTCSYECRGIALSRPLERVTLTCVRCGKPYETYPSRERSGRQFCRKGCPGPEVVWNPTLAYLVGLIASDGTLSSDRTHRISVSNTDMEIIEFVTSNVPMPRVYAHGKKVGEKTYAISSVSTTWENLYQFLIDIGLTPNKSLTIPALAVPDTFFFDFLRGVIDGDGTVGYTRERYLFIRIFSGSRTFLQWIAETIEHLGHVQLTPVRQGKSVFDLTINGEEAHFITPLIWNGGPHLSRKRPKEVQP